MCESNLTLVLCESDEMPVSSLHVAPLIQSSGDEGGLLGTL